MTLIDDVALAQSLIRCRSVTPADDGAQDIVAWHLTALKFQVDRKSYPVAGGIVHTLHARRGVSGPHFGFNSHTDVVPPGDESDWTYPPFEAVIADGKLWGRGTVDNKGSLACFIAACDQFFNAYDVAGSVSIMVSGDEETTHAGGSKKIMACAKENNAVPDFILVGEPTNPTILGEEIKNGRRGSFYGHITINGKQGHAAYPEKADNPCPKLAKLFAVLADIDLDKGNEFFQPSNLQITSMDVGNKTGNVIPARATGDFAVRFNTLWTPERLESFIRAKLDETGIAYEIKTRSPSQPFLTQPGAHTEALIKAVRDVTGRTPAYTTNGGTSDARFIHEYCPVAEFGLINETIHAVNEFVRIEDMKSLTEIYKRTLENFFTGHLKPRRQPVPALL